MSLLPNTESIPMPITWDGRWMKGKYVPSRLFTSGVVLACKTISGFQLDLEYVFRDLD